MTPPWLAQLQADPLPLQARTPRDTEEREREEEGKHYDKPDEAAAYYKLKRTPQNMSGVPPERYATARKQMEKMRTYSSRLQEFVAPSTGQAATELLYGTGSHHCPLQSNANHPAHHRN